MNQYYYAVSSLPFLDFESAPLLTLSEFMDICRSTLTEKDFEVISSLHLNGLKGSDFSLSVLTKWVSWEGTLRNEIAKLRADSLDMEAEPYLYAVESNTEAPGYAGIAYKLDSPLLAEESIDRARWQFLDELESGHYFDLEKLIVYLLRLKILERRTMFTIEKGNENFQKIYENIKESVREA